MKDSIKWIVWLLVALAVSVAASWALLGYRHEKTVGAITSPPTVFDFLQLTQGLGFGTLGTTPLTQTGTRLALPATSGQILCSIANPYTSTSTVTDVTFQNITSTTTSQVIVVGTTTSATATSSSISSITIGANAQQTFSFDGGLNNNIIGPGQFVTVGTGNGGLSSGVQYNGTCNVSFQSVS